MEQQIFDKCLVVSKLYESITTMTTTTTTGNTKDSNNTKKGDNKVLIHILKDIDLDFLITYQIQKILLF